MQISYLHDFVVLVSYMSFTKASRELNMSQPTLSNHIAALEKEVGVPILDRDATQMVLTPAGRLFYERASQIAELYDRSLKDCRQLKTQETLILKRPMNLDYVESEFSLIFTEFLTACPKVIGRVIDATNIFVLDEIIAGHIDLAVVTACKGDNGFLREYSQKIRLQPFLLRPLGIATRPDNPLARKPDLTIGDLEKTIFSLPADLRYKEAEMGYRSFLEHNGVKPTIEHISENDLHTLFMMNIAANRVQFIGAEAGYLASQMGEGYVVTPFNPPVFEECYFAYSADNHKGCLKDFINLVASRGVVEKKS